jgi:hypothetical protein
MCKLSSSISARKLSSRNIFENGVRVFLAMYNAPKSEHNIDNFRYTQFIKLTRLNKPMRLSSLPPTNAAALSCHQEWGWILQNDILEPTTALLPLAPEKLLYRISCNCKKGRGSSCGCRKLGLQCSSVCGQYNGQACLIASSYLDDLKEASEYARI